MKFEAYKARREAQKARREEIHRQQSAELGDLEMALDDEVRRVYQLGLSAETVYFKPRKVEAVIGSDGVRLRFADRHDPLGDCAWLPAMGWGRFAEIMNTYERWVLGHIDEMPPSGPWPAPSWRP